MKLEVGKKYKTRNGEIVECVAVWNKSDEADFQATVLNNNLCSYNYKLNGSFNYVVDPYARDIVEECKEKRSTKVFINLYKGYNPSTHLTREEADARALVARLACIERDLLWEDDEGLESLKGFVCDNGEFTTWNKKG